MNLPINIKDLFTGKIVEWERLEFKAGWNPEDILHTLCAFANDFHNLGGGYIIIGVAEENGQPVLPPVGLNPASVDGIQKEILNLGYHAIQPYYHPLMVPTEFQGKTILILRAMGGQTRPYKAKKSLAKNHKNFAWYIRKGSSTVQARGSDEAELISLAATVPFDDRFNQQARVGDLSPRLIEEFLQEIGSGLAEEATSLSLEDLGRQMSIVGGPVESPFPLNIGLMMFNPEPSKFFPYTQIDVVWFGKEGAGGDQFSEKIFKGPIHIMTREALDFIKRNFITETVIKHPDRAEATRVENFPYPAIEEAVVNAVYHRAYDVREPVEIRIYQDEIFILSYPGPDRSVKLEALRQGRANPRRYRNRRIGEFLKELKMTEGRGTGISKIKHAMQDNGSPEAEFEFDEDHRYFQVRLPVHEAVKKAEEKEGLGTGKDVEAPSGVESGVHDGVHDGVHEIQLTSTMEKILQSLSEPSSTAHLLEKLGYSTRTRNYVESLKKLLSADLIAMTLPDTPRSKNQKYRLTKKGKRLLAKKD
ncbi:RNA-binding domain-containing protein [Desulfoplanes sp. PS50]